VKENIENIFFFSYQFESSQGTASVECRCRRMRSDKGSREGEGSVVVEKVGGRSSATSCFSRYPLRFFIPKKVFSLISLIFGSRKVLYIKIYYKLSSKYVGHEFCISYFKNYFNFSWFIMQISLTEYDHQFLI